MIASTGDDQLVYGPYLTRAQLNGVYRFTWRLAPLLVSVRPIPIRPIFAGYDMCTFCLFNHCILLSTSYRTTRCRRVRDRITAPPSTRSNWRIHPGRPIGFIDATEGSPQTYLRASSLPLPHRQLCHIQNLPPTQDRGTALSHENGVLIHRALEDKSPISLTQPSRGRGHKPAALILGLPFTSRVDADRNPHVQTPAGSAAYPHQRGKLAEEASAFLCKLMTDLRHTPLLLLAVPARTITSVLLFAGAFLSGAAISNLTPTAVLVSGRPSMRISNSMLTWSARRY